MAEENTKTTVSPQGIVSRHPTTCEGLDPEANSFASSKPASNNPGSRTHSQDDNPLVDNLATTHITDEQPREPRLSESEEIVVVDELGQGVLNSTDHDPPYRITSISSEDLLAGDGEEGGVGAELHPEDTDLDFALEESMDEQQFEVVDTVDPVESQTESHSGFQQECTGDSPISEKSLVDPSDEDVSNSNAEREGEKEEEKKEEGGDKEEDNKSKKKRAISPIVFEKKESHSSSKPEKTEKSDRSKSRDKSKDHHSGPHRIVDKLFSNTRYFVMKSNNHENIAIAKDRGVWSTPPYNEKKLNKAYRDCRNVLLVFSVRESGRFQGIARLMSDSRRDGPHIPWVLPPGISQAQLGGVFKLEWIHKGTLEFSACQDLKNPWNDNKPVKISRDGQEVEPTVGEKLCRLWQKIETDSDTLSGHPNHHSSSSASHSPYMPHYPPRHHHHPSYPAPNPYFAGYPMGPYMFADRRMHPMPPQPSAVYPTPSKHQLTEAAEALLGDIKKKKTEKGEGTHKSSSSRKTSHHRHSAEGGSSSSSSSHRREAGSGRSGERDSHREREKEREKEKRRERSGRGEERKSRHTSRKEKEKRKRSRSRSRSPGMDFGGVRAETLLHGSYADYIKEYSTRSSSSHKTPHSMTDVRAAYQKALSQVASALAQQSTPKVDSKAYKKRVEEFLAKARNGEPMGANPSSS